MSSEPTQALQSAALPPPSPPCLQKALGYWIYEVCIGSEVRQFHSVVRGVDRREITSLGKLHPAETAMQNVHQPQSQTPPGTQPEAQREAQAEAQSQLQPQPQPQRYVGGDVCEGQPSKLRREVAISTGCGKSDRIVDVREPEACRYEIDIELRSACSSLN